MAVPKKRTSTSKKHIRRNIWIKKGYLITKKASFLSKFIYIENSKSFIKKQTNHKAFGFLVKKPIGIDIN
uniref:ribosomal protein L32 n=1 Tax=Juncus gracilicaulis TaxID=511724 RepID=UPI001F12902A|nr:ribosomal protein L32 [Juncus gracilicaulis]ULQ66840.1 ribosomal protein L32 [Juncus gracilicaulis]